MHSFQIQFSYSRQVNERVMFGSYSWKLMMISCLTYKQIHKLTLVTVLLCDHLIEVCNDVHFQFENSQFYLWVNEGTTTYMYIYFFVIKYVEVENVIKLVANNYDRQSMYNVFIGSV